jgi:hypothetical protein
VNQRAISLCSNLVSESCLGDGRCAHLADRGAGEHQSHARADQRQGAGQDEGGVEAAGGLDEVTGHDRGEETETVAAQHQERESPAGIGRRAQQIADEGTVGGWADIAERGRDRDQNDDRGQ